MAAGDYCCGNMNREQAQTWPNLREVTIVSGGQTGADRAALDFAIAHGIAHGGWCPRGRLAEDGTIDPRYLLRETPSRKYAQRTEWNIRDSDATVVFSLTPQVSGGTALTIELAKRLGKPWLLLTHDSGESAAAGAGDAAPHLVASAAKRLLAFLAEHHVRRLNLAGPRASQEPRIAPFVARVLAASLAHS